MTQRSPKFYGPPSYYKRQGGRVACVDCEYLLAKDGEPEDFFGHRLLPASYLADGRQRCPACCFAASIPHGIRRGAGDMWLRVPAGWEKAAERAFGGRLRKA